MSKLLKDVGSALKLVAKLASSLRARTIATAVAGIVAPIVAKVVGANVTVAEVTGWLVLVGTVAATLESLQVVRKSK